jgi:hypothetical protein
VRGKERTTRSRGRTGGRFAKRWGSRGLQEIDSEGGESVSVGKEAGSEEREKGKSKKEGEKRTHRGSSGRALAVSQ